MDLQRTGSPPTAYNLYICFHMGGTILRPDQERGYQLRYVQDWGAANSGLQLWRKTPSMARRRCWWWLTFPSTTRCTIFA